MNKYGIYLTYSRYPFFTGTREKCKQRIDGLTDAQREQGWTIAPVPLESCDYDGPVVDPALVKRVWITALALTAVVVLLYFLLLCAQR